MPATLLPVGAAYALPSSCHQPRSAMILEEPAEGAAAADLSMSPPPSYSPVEYGDGSVFHISVPAIDMATPSNLSETPTELSRSTPERVVIETDGILTDSNRLSHSDGLRPYDGESLLRRHSDTVIGRDTPLSDDNSSPPVGSRQSALRRHPLTTQISHNLPSISTRPRNNEFEEVTLTSNLSLGLPNSRRESLDIVPTTSIRLPTVSRPTSVFVRTYSSSSFETPSNEDEDESEDSFSSSSCFDGDEAANPNSDYGGDESPVLVGSDTAIPLSHATQKIQSCPSPLANAETMSVGDLELESTHIETGDCTGIQNGNFDFEDSSVATVTKFRSKTAGPLKGSRVRPTDL